jgi:hypothetical protein
MPLTPQQQQAALEWINAKRRPPGKCSWCGEDNWSVGNHIVAPADFSDGVFSGTVGVPFLPVMCGNCGLSMLFSAAKIGLIGPPSAGYHHRIRGPR